MWKVYLMIPKRENKTPKTKKKINLCSSYDVMVGCLLDS